MCIRDRHPLVPGQELPHGKGEGGLKAAVHRRVNPDHHRFGPQKGGLRLHRLPAVTGHHLPHDTVAGLVLINHRTFLRQLHHLPVRQGDDLPRPDPLGLPQRSAVNQQNLNGVLLCKFLQLRQTAEGNRRKGRLLPLIHKIRKPRAIRRVHVVNRHNPFHTGPSPLLSQSKAPLPQGLKLIFKFKSSLNHLPETGMRPLNFPEKGCKKYTA